MILKDAPRIGYCDYGKNCAAAFIGRNTVLARPSVRPSVRLSYTGS